MDLLHQLLHADASERAVGPLVEAHAWFSSVDWPALRAGTALPPAVVADAMAPELLEKMAPDSESADSVDAEQDAAAFGDF